jgi:hypothetical protein
MNAIGMLARAQNELGKSAGFAQSGYCFVLREAMVEAGRASHAGKGSCQGRQPRPSKVARTAASSGVCGSTPSTDTKRLLSIRTGVFQR